MCSCSNLDIIDQFVLDNQEFKSLYIDVPKIEYTDECVIIRNAPDCDCYKKITKSLLVNLKICDSETDIHELSSGIIIAKRSDLDCECKRRGNPHHIKQEINNCNWYCDKATLAAQVWCAKVFKKIGCQAACVIAADLLKDGCYYCCSKGNIYETCIKPFSNITVELMGHACNPEWD